MKDERTFLYQLDSEDCLIFVNHAWLDFAVENGAPELTAEAVISRPVWDFIADMETRHLYRLILESVRTGQHAVSIPFRCDSPELRRFMTMVIAPLPHLLVEFSCRMERVEKRAPVRLLDPAAARGPGTVTICSWCRRVRLGRDRWAEVEKAVQVLGLFDEQALPMLTHGICQGCYEVFLKPRHPT